MPEPKHGKVRLHMDVVVDDIDQRIARVDALGGRLTGERHDYDEAVVVVMADLGLWPFRRRLPKR